MPKIRGVKPDYWTDEDIVDLSIPARLLFIGLWTYACDNGHLQDKPKQIKMRVLPGDDVNVTELLREIESQELILRGDGWITVPNLTRHQKPDRRYFTTCEREDCVPPPETVSQRESRRVHAVQPVGTPSAPTVPTPSAHVDGEGEVMVKVNNSSASADAEREFDDFWSAYPKKKDKGHGVKAYRSARKRVSQARIIEALERDKAGTWAQIDPRFIPYPASWLNSEPWEDEPDAPVTNPFPEDGTPEEQEAWVRAQPLPTGGAYYGGSIR